ncbi:glycosyltransferase [Paenibacillus alvei]|uniref:Glycosyltransferase n=4 Tax=Paenibacillus alvei TaxID=44250 RepID=A0ABT4GSD6_PAEAL|nr:glycosyltransferase [Paenibacillus alvei]MCY9703053.1 glycosyltransferase [Paenibacillus alvei]MCY9735724.1 glycosyltransferase [Paenibacillus alvei]MCY9752794.1 glycosyltransferase [Paenibacillus alvei]MCY9759616.1 glycosyltransferase [Paenibacillus alvei]MCY9766412.1 glycosyltransferase [Paenibacillus alvei]
MRAINNEPIAFVIHNTVLYETIKPVLRELERLNIGYDLFIPEIYEDKWRDMAADTYEFLKSIHQKVELINDKPQKNYTIAFYPYLPYYIEVDSVYTIRYQYGMAKPNWNFGAWSLRFDYILCNSTYDYSVLRTYAACEITGLLKFANFQKIKSGRDNDRPNLLYLPTYGVESSIEQVISELEQLRNEFNITIKLHHGTTYLEQARVELIKGIFPEVLDHRDSLVDLIARTDVILSDGSGAIFDALYTDTPIVIFPQMESNSFEGLLSLEGEMVRGNIVPVVKEKEQLREKLLTALFDETIIKKRREFANDLFPVNGKATIHKIINIIHDLLNHNIDEKYIAGHNHLVKDFLNKERKISELNQKFDDLNNDYEKIKDEINRLGSENTELKSIKDEFQTRYNSLYSEFQDKEIELLTSKLQLSETEKKLIDANKREFDLENQLEVQLRTQENELKTLENELRTLENQLKTSETNEENLKILVNDKDLKNQILRQELENIYLSKRWRVANQLKGLLYKSKLIYIHKGYSTWKQYGFKVFFKKSKLKISKYLKKMKNNEKVKDRSIKTQNTIQEEIMNWYEYKFFRFKEKFNETYQFSLNDINFSFEKDLVSVVLPVYNGEDYLSSAIESILQQTYRHFELIIINDGSTDNTSNILNEYEQRDSRITVIHQENSKIPKTLSRGFRMAKGEFYTWTSADNILHKSFLEDMVNEIKKDENLGMVYANMNLIDSNGKIIRGHGWYEIPEGSGVVSLPTTTLELNIYPNNTIGAAFMYRAKAAHVLGDYSSFKHTLEDYDYWMRMNSLFNLCHTSFHEPIYDYRWHDKSLTAQDSELGITSNRYKLMVLDDYRRDYYLSPIVWIIDGDGDLEFIKKKFREKGDTLLELEDLGKLTSDNLAIPICYLYISENENVTHKFPDHLPSEAHRVICVNKNELLKNTALDWDLFCSTDEKIYDGVFNSKKVFQVTNSESLYSLISIKVKNDHLYLIEETIETKREYSKKVSVVICTYKRSEKLANALASVVNQSFLKNDYEIIIVNNDIYNNEILQLVQEYKEKFNLTEDFIRYHVAPLKGLSFARNVGMFSARGEIILYIDDDALADDNLLEETYNCFSSDSKLGVVGGNIILNLPDPVPGIVRPGTEAYWSQLIISDNEIKYSNYQWEFPYGANYAVRKDSLLRIGGFRTSYGRKGNDYAGGEEIVVSFMMKEIGYKVALNPKMKVIHDVDHSRYTIEHVQKTMLSSLITNYQLQVDLYAPMESNLDYDIEHLNILKEEYSKTNKDKITEESSIDLVYKKSNIEAYEKLIEIKRNDLKKRER